MVVRFLSCRRLFPAAAAGGPVWLVTGLRPRARPPRWRQVARRPRLRLPGLRAGERDGRRTGRSVQQHYDAVHDFSAEFTHAYEGGALRRKTTERGTVLVKKPGKMRWGYKSPEEKLFVSDGRKIYFYVPADKQVTVSTMPAEDKASTPILFLVGKGNLSADFAVSYADDTPGLPADTLALKLVPKAKTPDYDSLILVVDRRALTLPDVDCARRAIRNVNFYVSVI